MGVLNTKDQYIFKSHYTFIFPEGPDENKATIQHRIIYAHRKHPWKTIDRRGEEFDDLWVTSIEVEASAVGQSNCFDATVYTEPVHTLEQVHAYQQYTSNVSRALLECLPEGTRLFSWCEIASKPTEVKVSNDVTLRRFG